MQRQMLKTFGILIALVLALAAVTHASDGEMTARDIPMIGDMEALPVGTEVAPFELKSTAGEPYSFDPKRPGAHLLVFWSIFCEPCRAEMPLIQSYYDHYKDDGFEVVTVVLDGGDLADNIDGFIKQGKFTFHVLLDEETEDGSLVVAEDYMVPGTPTVYVINSEGKITFATVGRTPEEEFEGAIKAALGK